MEPVIITIILFQTGQSWPSGWTVIGWSVAAVVAALYLFSGYLEKIGEGRKDLLDVGDKRIANLIHEKDELQFKNNELQKRVEEAEKNKNEIERDKAMLMREHHQLLEMSVADLNTLKTHTKLIEQLENEVNRYREEKGLTPRARTTRTVE
ncbi:hypothetical protein BH09PAT1_BH09PAT1_1460 [soil metagenome]